MGVRSCFTLFEMAKAIISLVLNATQQVYSEVFKHNKQSCVIGDKININCERMQQIGLIVVTADEK